MGAAYSVRDTLKLACCVFALSTLAATTGCGPRNEYNGPQVTSQTDGISPKLRQLETLLSERGFPVDELNPGLSREAIAEKVAHLPYPFPEELYQLYMWKNGTQAGSALFLFRDQVFSSIDVALSDLESLQYFEIEDAFPFAAFEGSYYVLPAQAYAFNEKLERPVVEVFEGVDVYFFSIEHMLDTQIAWIKEGIHAESDSSGFDRYERELKIWRKHNPGIF